MKFFLRRLASVCLLVALATSSLAACTHAVTASHGNGLDDAISTLASGGVATYEDVNTTVPIVAIGGAPSAMRFTRWQIQNLVAEAYGHSGYLGANLDALAAPPAGGPAFSTLVGAWLTRHDGALAQYAQGLMGTQNYKKSADVVFPAIVVMLFIGDIARPQTTSQLRPSSFDYARLVATPAQADGICTDVSNWVTATVSQVVAAVQVDGSSWIAGIWNSVVSLAGSAVTTIVAGVSQSVVAFVIRMATICGTIMQVASMFTPWTVTLAANPPSMTLGPAAQNGSFNAKLNAQDIPWPATLTGCVQAISNGNVSLTDASYKDAPVQWTNPVNIPALATRQSADATLAENKTAKYSYESATREAVSADDCPVAVPAGTAAITVIVKRTDVSRVLHSLESLITSNLGSTLQGYLEPFIDPAIETANSKVSEFVSPSKTVGVAMTEYVADPLCQHTPPPNTPAPSPSHLTAGDMAFESCESLLTPADTAPYLNGAVKMDIQMPDGSGSFGQMMGAMVNPAAAANSTYDMHHTTYCTIASGTQASPKVAALFFTAPRATTYVAMPAPANPQPGSCWAVLGVENLKRLNAYCEGGGNSLMVLGPDAEYGITIVPPLGTEAGMDGVMKHIITRM